MTNPWEVLGLSPTDDLKLIRKAYADKLRLYHPEEFPQEYQALQEAYRFLADYLRHGISESLGDIRQVDTSKSTPEGLLVSEERKPGWLDDRLFQAGLGFQPKRTREGLFNDFEELLYSASWESSDWEQLFEQLEGQEEALKHFLIQRGLSFMPTIEHARRLRFIIRRFLPDWEESEYVYRLELWEAYLPWQSSLFQALERFEGFYRYQRTLKRTLEESAMLNDEEVWTYLLDNKEIWTNSSFKQLASLVVLALDQISNPKVLLRLWDRFREPAYRDLRQSLFSRYQQVVSDQEKSLQMQLVEPVGIIPRFQEFLVQISFLIYGLSLYQLLSKPGVFEIFLMLFSFYQLSYQLVVAKSLKAGQYLPRLAYWFSLVILVSLILALIIGDLGIIWLVLIGIFCLSIFVLPRYLLPGLEFQLISPHLRTALLFLFAPYLLASWALWFLIEDGVSIGFVLGIMIVPLYIFSLLAWVTFRRQPAILSPTFYKKNAWKLLLSGLLVFFLSQAFRVMPEVKSLLLGLNHQGIGYVVMAVVFNIWALPEILRGKFPLADFLCQYLALVQLIVALLIGFHSLSLHEELRLFSQRFFFSTELLFLGTAFVSYSMIPLKERV